MKTLKIKHKPEIINSVLILPKIRLPKRSCFDYNTHDCGPQAQFINNAYEASYSLIKKKRMTYRFAKKLENLSNLNVACVLFRTATTLRLCSKLLFAKVDKNGNLVRDKDGRIVRHYKKCRNRLCQVCQSNRQFRITRNITNHLESKFKYNPLEHQVHFLTITIKNNANLKDSFDALSNRLWLSLKRRKDFPYSGWIKSFETTVDANGLYHPHLHVLLIRNKEEDPKPWYQIKWVEEVQKVLGVDYAPIIDIRAVKSQGSTAYETLACEISKTVSYAHKGSTIFYTDKLKHFSDKDRAALIADFITSMRKKRTIACGGSFFKGLKLTEIKKDPAYVKFEDLPGKLLELHYDPQLEEYIEIKTNIDSENDYEHTCFVPPPDRPPPFT